MTTTRSNQPLAITKMATAFLTWRRYLQGFLVPHDITLKQAYLLRQLVKRAYLYPSQVADMLYCDRPTATVIIKNTERKGWIKREKDPQNRKYVRIMITEAGKEKLAELQTSPWANPPFDPLACFTEEEVQELERLLNKLNRHLKQIKEEEMNS
ncbi:MAG: winged helix-turn-helix transcriptional regulator [Anaerolineae bacterium]|nr:winged helix-turn-helix transcriptional regulator [Anaerolineae bacterium]